MKTLEQLQEEYRAEEESFKKATAEHWERDARIRADVMSHAKYMPGDHVWYLERFFNTKELKRTPGIIRAISAGRELCGNKIVPLYTVGKVTKSGAIHATHNIGWRDIAESEIEPRDEDPAKGRA